MHDLWGIVVVIAVVLVGQVFNWSSSNGFRTDMKEFHTEVNTRFDRIDDRFRGVDGKLDKLQSDLNVFHRSMGQHDKAIEILEKKVR